MSVTNTIRHAEELYEHSHVHSVYNSIASHFSQTRYKPWPIVEKFILNLAPGSVGVDVGCGNGKYLAVRNDVFILGSDRSDELIKIAAGHESHEALVGDALNPPHPDGRFDFAISIAVLHHLSTRERRVDGVRSLLRMLKPALAMQPLPAPPKASDTAQRDATEESGTSGQGLIFVWALEQKDSRRGWDEGGEQDVLVPWVLKPGRESSKQNKSKVGQNKGKSGKKSKQRTQTDENSQNNDQHDQEVNDTTDKGASNDNPAIESLCDHQNEVHADMKQNGTQQTDVKTAQHEQQQGQEKVYQRYYHLYRKGELEEDVISAGGEVIDSGYERDNWWCIFRRKSE